MASVASHSTAAAPTPQEVSRKLSISHKPAKKPLPTLSTLTQQQTHSGNESDSDSLLSPDISAISISHSQSGGGSSTMQMNPPLTSIAEATGPLGSAEESDEDDEDGDIWRVADKNTSGTAGEVDEENECVIKAGYLWKKGVRRKTWKKRWFVLRPLHLAVYKTSAEYKLLRLLDLNEVHAVTPCALKRHTYTFGLVSPLRTFYLQAASQQDMENWVKALNQVRETLMTTSTLTGHEAPTPPIPVPIANQGISSMEGALASSAPGPAVGSLATTLSSSPISRRSYSPGGHYVTSSDDDDFVPSSAVNANPTASTSASMPIAAAANASLVGTGVIVPKGPPSKDPSKPVLSGYLMKCGSKRRNWRKRWFVLTGEKLFYSGSHMDTKPHRIIDLERILDALEYDPFYSGVHGLTLSSSHNASSHSGQGDDTMEPKHTFKIVTTKRTLLLSAPSELEEIKWLSTVRALIARRSSNVATINGGGSSSQSNANTSATGTATSAGIGGGGSTWVAQPSQVTPVKVSASGHDQSRGSAAAGIGMTVSANGKRDGRTGTGTGEMYASQASRQRSGSVNSGVR